MLFLFLMLLPGIQSSDPYTLSLKNIRFSVGRYKPICSLEISYSDEQISKAKVTCSIQRRTLRGIKFEHVTKTRHKIALTFTILRRKATAVVTNKNVETSRIVFHLNFVFTSLINLVPCEFGYAPVCNSSKSSDEKTAICPAENFVNLTFSKNTK